MVQGRLRPQRAAPGPLSAIGESLGKLPDRARRDRRLLVAAAVLLVVSFPIQVTAVSPGIDPSWQAGLSMAVDREFVFGRDVLFTYGPLGYLTDPVVADPWLGLVAILVRVLAYVALVAIACVLLRRGFTGGAAALVAVPVVFVMVALIADEFDLTFLVLLVVGGWAIRLLSTPASHCRLAAVIGLGAISGVAVLVKADAVALGAVALYAVAASAYGSRGAGTAARHAAVFVAAVGAALVAGWGAAGQPMGGLGDWLGGSFEVARGYGDAQGIEAGRWFEWAEYGLAGVVAAAYLSLTARAQRLAPRRRWALVGLVALLLFVGFKMSFVRHDNEHVAHFFALAAVLALALLPLWGRWRGLVALGVATAALVVVLEPTPRELADPTQRLERLADLAELVVSSDERDAFVERSRAELRREYALPRPVVERLAGRTVHIDPWEIAVAFAYPHLVWRPTPVFQSYQANTPYLDDLNADLLAGHDGPAYVLRQPGRALDDRAARFESPRAMLELACHYREVYADDAWQLLERGRDRCGAARALASRRAHLGEPVPVPPAGEDTLVVATFDGLGDGVLDRLRSLVYKGPEFYLSPDAASSRYRLLAGTEGQPHVLNAPRCAPDLGAPRRFDELVVDDRLVALDGSYNVEFFVIPYECRSP